MKKKYLIFFLLIFVISNNVKAEEKYKDITEEVKIKYKWYKEIQGEGGYYPLRKITNSDKYDINNIKYIRSHGANSEYCSYPKEFYELEKKTYRIYRKVYDTEYITIENVTPQTNIKIYYKNKSLEYQIISHENNVLTIKLQKKFVCDELLFYVDTNENYKINLYDDSELKFLIISKNIENQKISVPDLTWQVEPNAYYLTSISVIEYNLSSLTTLIEEKEMCSYKEKYVYKYNVERVYYDNDYHEYIEGYIKDEENTKLYYKEEPIVINNTVEIIKEKIKEVPKIEYIYIEKEVNNEEFKTECPKEIETKIETKIIEKEIKKTPKKIYILIILLTIIVMILVTKEIIKKCRIN